GNLLLVGGLSFFVGGLKHKRQTFNIHNAQHNAGMLIFSIILAFIIPKIFTVSMCEQRTMALSIVVSITLIVLYLEALLFKLVTHRGIFQTERKKSIRKKLLNGEKERRDSPCSRYRCCCFCFRTPRRYI